MDTLLQTLKDLPEPVLVVAHPRPDGDAVGSIVAMREMLRNWSKDAIAYMPDLPEYLKFAAHGVETEKPSEFASIVMVDVTERERTPLEPADFMGKVTICIDHHVDNSCEANVTWVEPSFSSACEMIWNLAMMVGVTRQMAEACYLGMRMDTGGFTFTNVTSETMRAVGECIDAGADISAISTQLSRRTMAEIELLKQALTHTVWCQENSIATVVLSQHDLRNVPEPDMQGIMTMLRSVEGAVAVVALTENKDGSWRGSIRAVDGLVVNDIAGLYGGGGHPQAAGFRLEADADVFTELKNITDRISQAAGNG